MWLHRKELSCQYGVCTNDPNEHDCGKPVVAFWDWNLLPPHSGGAMYVCEEHDRIIDEAESNIEEGQEGSWRESTN